MRRSDQRGLHDREPDRVAAIPTRCNGVDFRSRLEARWSCMFDLLGWSALWTYEPVDLPGTRARSSRIPDFMLAFANPTLIECKPAVTVTEVRAYRAALHAVARDWVCADALARVRELDAAPDQDGDLAEIDGCVEFLDHVSSRGDNAPGPGRRALVVGACLFPVIDGSVTIDGYHRIAAHGDHLALVDGDDYCVVCGATSAVVDDVPAATVIAAWRDAGNTSRWQPDA